MVHGGGAVLTILLQGQMGGGGWQREGSSG